MADSDVLLKSGNKVSRAAVRMNQAWSAQIVVASDAAKRLKIHAVNSLLPAWIRELLVRYRTLQERG